MIKRPCSPQSFFVLICTGLLACAAQVHAQGQTRQVPPAITQFDDATISRLLLDGQTTWRVESGPDGRPVYRVSAQGGLNFTVQPQVCAPDQGCTGLLVIATFPPAAPLKLDVLDTLLRRFNDTIATAKVYRTDDGTVLLQAYVNAAFGISYANAQAHLLVFDRNVQTLRSDLSSLNSGS